MLGTNFVRRCVIAAMVAAVGIWSASAVAAEAGALDLFKAPDGTNYFSLAVKAPAAEAPAAAREIVVLFNTSATQVGEDRTKAFGALKSFLTSLPAGDRVRLIAVDLNAIPLTKGFVAPDSKEMNEAVTAIDARVPLGSTDMSKAVSAALESYAAESRGRGRRSISATAAAGPTWSAPTSFNRWRRGWWLPASRSTAS